MINIKLIISITLIIIIIKLILSNTTYEFLNNKFSDIGQIVVIHDPERLTSKEVKSEGIKNNLSSDYFNPENKNAFLNIEAQQKYFQLDGEQTTSQVNFKIFNQINPSDINLANYNIKYPWISKAVQEANINDKLKVEKEEVSTYLNYLNLFNDFANFSNEKNVNKKNWFLILNDNFNIIPNRFGERNLFLENLSNLITNIPNDADIVFLGYSQQVKCGKKINNFVCSPTIPLTGLNGYLVTKESAQKLYKLMEYIDVPIENKMTQLIIENKIHAYIVINQLINSQDI